MNMHIIEKIIKALVSRKGELDLDDEFNVHQALKEYSTYDLQELQYLLLTINQDISWIMILNRKDLSCDDLDEKVIDHFMNK